MMKNNMYDVSKYSQSELYDILDVINPSDRELEAKIIFLYKKYKNMQNDSGEQLAKFFEDIYNHFFETEDFENETGEKEDFENEEIKEGLENINTTSNNVVTTHVTPQSSTNTSDIVDIINTSATNIGFTKPLGYAQDKLNPLLQQTTKRIISIDSQYRDNKKTLSTQFTFNLSEPLKDVVSLKLYSIQIPYTWYTISNSFGSNFFYLKGNSPGINDGTYDYKIDISAGNYTPDNLVTAINTKIKQIVSTNIDISFGTTNISYNANTSLCTMTFDIKKMYNETSYYLYFPTWTNPNADSSVNGLRYQSIPGFLGYNYQTYYPNILNSSATLPSTTNTISEAQDNNSAIYFVDASNNYMTIIKYIGPDEYSGNSIVDLSFNVHLSLSGIVTRKQLVADLTNQIATNTYLSDSGIARIDITDPSSNSYGNSYYQLKIKFNRLTTNNIENSKIYVKFPTEITTTNYNSIWTGGSSCFRFQTTGNELNNIISETASISPQSETYIIVNNPYIYLKCSKTGYDVSSNDYKITLANSNTLGYTLSEYINSITNALVTTNNTTITSKNPLGDFNMTYTTAYMDSNSYFNFQADINKKFNQDMYSIDLSGSILKTILNLSGDYLNGIADLSGSTYNFSSSFQQNSRYTIDSSYLLIATPSQNNYGNQNSTTYVVPFLSRNATTLTDSVGNVTSKYYSNFSLLQTDINNSFINFTDNDGTHIFTGTNITLSTNKVTTTLIDCSFTIAMQKILTQNDYKIGFYDASGISTDNTLDKTQSSWYKYLNLDASYLTIDDVTSDGYALANLSSTTSYIKITGTKSITVNKMRLYDGSNNYFYIKPYEYGVASQDGANDIKFIIPTDTLYTRDLLVSTINTLLQNNSLTRNSSATIITMNNIDYTKIRLNINKIYSASDYNLVFYDQYSFVKCYTGVSSVTNATWDTTLGWILGYRNSTVYYLSDYGSNGNIIQMTGDTTVSVNLFNYFLLCIDDFNQNHLNDGLVTLTSADTSIPLPSYANRANYTCDPVSGLLTYNSDLLDTVDYTKLTQNQVYSLTQIANNKRASSIISKTSNISSKSYGSGPFVKDVFGLIPMKTSGLANGSVYVDFSGTLQNQERSYFGPVNIHRLSISLVSDRGDTVDLNGSNWSFSLICEQIYQQKPTSTTK